MTNEQWSALIRMTRCGNGDRLSVEASLGKITLIKKDDGRRLYFDLEYPSHSVSLYWDVDIPSTDGYYLHYMYDSCIESSLRMI